MTSEAIELGGDLLQAEGQLDTQLLADGGMILLL